MEEESFIATPPPGPPPLLSTEQLIQLAQQGWLCLGLPEALSKHVADLFETSPEFFELPQSEKLTLYPSRHGTEFGYYHVQGEKEYVTFRCHIYPTSISTGESCLSLAPRLEGNAAKAWRDAALVLFRILCDIARASDLDISVWTDILDGTLTMPDSEDQMTYTLMRLFHYFPLTGCADEHTDLGLLTLCIGDSEGLQVLDQLHLVDGNRIWIDPACGTRTATILVGQTLRALANRTLNAGVHRVVGNPNGRKSVVFALRHSSKHNVDFGLFGGQGQADPRDVWKMINVGKVNINTAKQRRDVQRARYNATRSEYEDIRHSTTNPG